MFILYDLFEISRIYLGGIFMNIKKFFKLFFLALVLFGVISTQNRSSSKSESEIWMSKLADDERICNLNIPGTHDSGTARTTIFTCTFASCQSDSISEQLKKGIRYLDIRIDANLLVNHGGVSCYKNLFRRLYLGDVLNYVDDFLKNNPSETVIIQLKEEGTAKGNFSKNINDELALHHTIYDASAIPSQLTLKDLRGKALIFTRSGSINNAYNYRGWSDDCSYCKMNIGGSTAILQDKYNETQPEDKMDHIRYFYSNVWENYSGTDIFYINFTSCTGIANPKSVAKKINTSFKSFVLDNNQKKFGIVLMDNPDSSLIQDIYRLNYSK